MIILSTTITNVRGPGRKNKTSYTILYSGQNSSVETQKLESNVKIGGHTKKGNKNVEKSKRLQL